jgi:DNA-binding winged helix-turn-helix (wHTH) protein/TolB-like protein/Flp pilus assembly protein TadD
MSQPADRFYEFGPFRIDCRRRILFREGQPVPLTPKAFDTLVMLVENSGSLVEKDRLMNALWPETFVEQGSLTRNVSALRKALGESPHDHQYIVTVPGEGYRFVAAVRTAPLGAPLTVKEQSRTSILIQEAEAQESRPVRVSLTVALRMLSPRARTAAIMVAGLVALAAVGVVIRMTRTPEPIDSVAVLPFTTAGDDPEAEYISETTTDSVLRNLSQLPRLRVIARSTVFSYKGRQVDPLQVGKDLKVRGVVVGRLLRRADALAMDVELVDTRDGSRVWGEHYDGPVADLMLLQNKIAREVSRQLRIGVTREDERKLSKTHTSNTEAYELYLKGRHFSTSPTEAELWKSIESLKKAIEKDAAYAPAHAELALSYYLLSGAFLRPDEAMPEARAAAARALELDESVAEAHLARALVSAFYDYDWSDADREFRRAIDLNPGYSKTHELYGYCLSAMGRSGQAVSELRQAQQLDPISPTANAYLGLALMHAGQLGQAVAQLRETISLHPGFVLAHHLLGWAYQQQGLFDQSLAELDVARSLDDNSEVRGLMAYVHAVSGQRDKARDLLAQLERRASEGYVNPFVIAGLYAGLGDQESAFQWLERTYAERSDYTCWLKVDPRFTSLRQHPRFAHLLRRVGLAG